MARTPSRPSQPRQRPLAGQRSRARLDPGGAAPVDDTAVTGAGAPATTPAPRRTAVLEPPAAAAVDSAGPAPERPDRPRRRTPDLLLMVAGVVVVALVLTATLLTLRARGEDRTEQARTEAVAAAESRAVDLLSYDYRHLDRDFGRAAAGLTGGFADDYATTTESVVRPTAEQVHAVVQAEVVSSSVVRAAQNQVTVLLFVNQTTTSTRVEGPQVDLNRVRMTLQRTGGDWKISAVTAL